MVKKRIKIIHVYKDFEIYNGLFTSLLILAKYMDHEIFDLRLCVFKYNGSPYGKEFERLGGKIHNLNVRWKDNPFIIKKMVDLFKNELPDIIQTHGLKSNLYGRLAAKIAKIPIVIGSIWTLRDTAFSRIRRIRDRLFYPIIAYLNKHSDKVVVVSNFIRKEWDPTCESLKFEVIYLPFCKDKIVKNDIEESEDTLSILEDINGMKIGYVARLSEEKGHTYLIQALPIVLEKFPYIKLILAGSGRDENKLKNQVNSLGIDEHIIFLGHINNVFKFLEHIDLFVLPSRSDALPVAIIEAMSVGLPIVATNVGGIPEMIENDKTGILVSPQDSEELANAIIYLLSNPTKAKEMGLSGKKVALEKFTELEYVKKYKKLYENLINQKEVLYLYNV